MTNDPHQHSAKDFGEYRAKVVSIDDPEQLLRVQVRPVGLWDSVPDADLPWAEIRWPIGARAGEGLFTPIQVDDLVWIDFINGDTRTPRVTGSCHFAPSGVVDLPPNVLAGKALKLTLYGFSVEITPEKELKITQDGTGNLIQLDTKAFQIHSDVPITVNGKDVVNVNVDKAVNITVKDAVTIKADKPITLEAPKVLLGESSALEPSVLGDKLATWFATLKQYLENHQHQDSLGIPTTPPLTVTGPADFAAVLSGGDAYSKKNKNQ